MTPSSPLQITTAQKQWSLSPALNEWEQKTWQNYIFATFSPSLDSPQKLSWTKIPILPPPWLDKSANRWGSNRISAPLTTCKLMARWKEQIKTWKPIYTYFVMNNKTIGQHGYLSHNSLSIADCRIQLKCPHSNC